MKPTISREILKGRRTLWRAFSFFLGVGLFAGMITDAWGLKERWVVGNEEHPWSVWGTVTAIDAAEHPGAIQPTESHGEINITQTLVWTAAKPSKFEVGETRVWDNQDPLAELSDPTVLVDGDPATSTEERFKKWNANQTGRTFYFDLGAPYSIDRIVFYPRQEGQDDEGFPYRDDYMKGYELFINDGRDESFLGGQPTYRMLRSNRKNKQSVVDISFSLQPIRIIKLRSASALKFEIAELELYGSGFASVATYFSEVIDLGGIANFGALEWTESAWKRIGGDLAPDPDSGAKIKVETRSGSDDTPLVYYEDKYGTLVEVDKTRYDILGTAKRGPIEDDTEHWSSWTLPAHTVSGDQIMSPAPRRYFQFRITLENTSVLEMMRVDSLWFARSLPPVADKLVGEVAILDDPMPEEGVAQAKAGERTTFTCDVKAAIASGQTGFDGLKIRMPSEWTFHELRMGNPLTTLNEDEYVVDAGDPGLLTLEFPSHKIVDSTLVRVIFDTAVLVYGFSFEGKAYDTEAGELPQYIEEGDANSGVGTNSLRVFVSESSLGDFLTDVTISPNPFTPNGDGVNDAVRIAYTLLQLTADAPVEVGIYTMAGQLVREVYRGMGKNGKYTRDAGDFAAKQWDGTDEHGDNVPPGLYLFKISVETDIGLYNYTGTLALVY